MFAEKMKERADEIASLQGTKGFYQQYAKNIGQDMNECMKDSSFNN